MKKCPYCAEEIQDEEIICRFCGRDLSPALSTASDQDVSPVPTVTTPPPAKTRKLLVPILVILSVIIIAPAIVLTIWSRGASPSSSSGSSFDCDKSLVTKAGRDIGDIFNRWYDVYKVASSTSRIALSAPVQNMQSIKRELDALSVPPCLTTAKRNLDNHMGYAIDGFLAFMAQETDTTVKSKFDSAEKSLTLYTDEMTRIAACAPNCK